MRLAAKVGQRTFGEDWIMNEYQVKVRWQGENIEIRFDSHDTKGMLKGGRLSVPPAIATQLGHALLLAASGALDREIAFTHVKQR